VQTGATNSAAGVELVIGARRVIVPASRTALAAVAIAQAALAVDATALSRALAGAAQPPSAISTVDTPACSPQASERAAADAAVVVEMRVAVVEAVADMAAVARVDAAGVGAKGRLSMKSPMRFPGCRLAAVARSVATILALAFGALPASFANSLFSSPAVAMSAFGDAIAANDVGAMRAILGSNFRDFIPPVGAEIRLQFLDAWNVSHAIQAAGNYAYIAVGNDGWTLPIPLVKTAKGWRFDTRAGVEEMRVRRISRNELAVIQMMLAIYDAQYKYALAEQHRSAVSVYAANKTSISDEQAEMSHPTRATRPRSPHGPGFSTASKRNVRTKSYYGYYYKLLTSQGDHAPGGAFDYVVNGRMLDGFAVLAWPVRYHDTGVMSFMMSHEGQVYERDLGLDGATKAAAMKSFDPDPGWRRVSP